MWGKLHRRDETDSEHQVEGTYIPFPISNTLRPSKARYGKPHSLIHLESVNPCSETEPETLDSRGILHCKEEAEN